ncbi:hypothetical protein FB45DRAFT_84060 [Roridomyces roridus]|uniref:GATA-type domain-containing protein n=1 Tax=Roridomyces roridus TaxID=1738132 RepID=A0AAD7FK16_9AGAR|nr:hypothetical protein FB45DRAFT_84060 [Roridomyces roridus]
MSALTPPQEAHSHCLVASPASSSYTLPSPTPPSPRYILPRAGCPSPSSISSSLSASPMPSTPPSPMLPASSSSKGKNQKCCSHCQTTMTPLWRRDPITRSPLCNACGLYLQQRHKPRPAALIAADAELHSELPDSGNWAPDAPTCTHCGAHKTSVWRRAKDGKRLCNACGVYVRLRGRPRPLTLKQSRVRPRARHP